MAPFEKQEEPEYTVSDVPPTLEEHVGASFVADVEGEPSEQSIKEAVKWVFSNMARPEQALGECPNPGCRQMLLYAQENGPEFMRVFVAPLMKKELDTEMLRGLSANDKSSIELLRQLHSDEPESDG